MNDRLRFIFGFALVCINTPVVIIHAENRCVPGFIFSGVGLLCGMLIMQLSSDQGRVP